MGRDSSREQNWPAGRLRKRSTWASQGCGTDADLHRLNGASPLNQLFRRPAASRIGDAARPPAEMTLIVLTRLAWVQPAASPVCPSQGRHACDRCDRSAQHTTPKYEVREVHYPWHPLFGHQVHVHGILHKLGRDLCRCWLPGQEDRIGFQVPAWMLDRAHCALMILRSEPATNLQVLLELRQLCDRIVSTSVVMPGKLRQATPITNGGNVDAKAQRGSRTGSAQLVRISPTASSMGGLTNGGPPSSHPPSLGTAVKQGRPVAPGQRGRRRRQ